MRLVGREKTEDVQTERFQLLRRHMAKKTRERGEARKDAETVGKRGSAFFRIRQGIYKEKTRVVGQEGQGRLGK